MNWISYLIQVQDHLEEVSTSVKVTSLIGEALSLFFGHSQPYIYIIVFAFLPLEE